MRVTHLSKVTGLAGSEGHLLRLLPGLARHGVEGRLIVLEDPRHPVEPFCRALRERGVEVELIAIGGHVDPRLPGHLTRRFRALRPDLVHTHLIHADLYGLGAAARAGVPCAVSSRHNNDAFRYNPVIKWLNRRAMRHAARVITISHALARFVDRVERVDPARIVTVHYGLEAPPSDPEARSKARARLGYAGDGPLAGFFGRLVRQKGVDVLLDAFSHVHRQHPTARLVVVGDGPQRPALEQQARKLGLGEVVTFTGWVEGARDLMPACDLIAVPSRWEGFGLVTLEAMGHACPLIVSQTSALPEIVVDGETGLHVPPEDPAALAGAINDLLADPETARAFGRAGYERLVTVFSVEKMVQATLDVYRDVMDTSTRVTH
jgi:glycosyltransferase involved in cell wall biosynthesis